MLKVENLVTPSPEDWEVTIKGMRLPFKSGDKSDSQHCMGKTIKEDTVKYCFVNEKTCTPECDCFILGENDEKLLLNLCKAGDPSHRKVLRQLPVKCFITAPLYWWKQADKYQIGTVTNSESTMHCLVKEPFKIEDFSTDYFKTINTAEEWWLENQECNFDGTIVCDRGVDLDEYFEECYLGLLNSLRDRYLKTNDMKYWYLINELLPQSYNQTRCWSGNYENLITIIKQRKNHKLIEWSQFSDFMLNNVPLLKEIIEVLNG